MVLEFKDRWRGPNTPSFLTMIVDHPTDQQTEESIRHRAGILFDKIVDFNAPEVKFHVKGITSADINDEGFQMALSAAMKKAGIKQQEIDGLFETGKVAVAKGAFKGR